MKAELNRTNGSIAYIARVQIQVLDVGTIQRQHNNRPIVDLPASLGGHLQ